MGFRIYFVSMTRLSLQIKSKLIFLTATWAHPAGVCRASCVPLTAGTADRSTAACWRPERFQREDSGRASRKRPFIFCKEGGQAGPLWPQRLSGRNNKEPIWTHILSLPLMEVSNSGVVRSLSQQVFKQSLAGFFVSGEKFWLLAGKKVLILQENRKEKFRQVAYIWKNETMEEWHVSHLSIYPLTDWLINWSINSFIYLFIQCILLSTNVC